MGLFDFLKKKESTSGYKPPTKAYNKLVKSVTGETASEIEKKSLSKVGLQRDPKTGKLGPSKSRTSGGGSTPRAPTAPTSSSELPVDQRDTDIQTPTSKETRIQDALLPQKGNTLRQQFKAAKEKDRLKEEEQFKKDFPIQGKIKEFGRTVQEKIEIGRRETVEFLLEPTISIDEDKKSPEQTLGKSFSEGIISAPFSLASFGVGALSDPGRTGKEFVEGIKEIPSSVQKDPLGFGGQLAGELIGQSLLFGGVRGAKTKIKLKDSSSVNVIKSKLPKSQRTPLEKTFGETIEILEPETKPSPKPTEVSLDPALLSELQNVRARLKSGADVFEITKTGDFKLVEGPKPKKKPKSPEVSFDPEFLSDLKSELSGVKSRLKSGADVFEITPEGKSKVTPAKKKKRPLEVDLDPDLKRRIAQELKEPTFEILEPQGPQQVIQKQRQAQKKVKEPLVLDLDTLQFQQFKPLKKVKKKKTFRDQIQEIPETQIQTFEFGVPRFVGGEGLSQFQVQRFGIKERAKQKQQTNQLSQFGETQAQQLNQLELQLPRQVTKQKQKGRQKFGALFVPKQKQRLGEKQMQPELVGELTMFKPLQKFRSAQKIFELQKQKERLGQFSFPRFDLLPEPRKKRDPEPARRKTKKPPVKKTKKRKTPIRTSFTGIVLEIDPAARITERGTVSPFQIRGLRTGLDFSKKKVKNKKK